MVCHTRQQGFSLIEVLVTLVVLSVGIMGAAGLQFSAMRANEEALQRTRATLLVEGMIERIRANAAEAGLKAYATNTSVMPSSTTQTCTQSSDGPAAVAQYDICEWQRELALDGSNGGFRNAQGCISVSANEVTVALAWQGTGATTAQGECGDDAISVARKDVVLKTVVYSADGSS
ncbi:type IV pilus modification protein PilV [Phytohalomonas tamaricis]|uniref:type IV pilus modification protein PilV n=1 Tax=Phytohalomonas tamaricis TaxID=2081032 RepID=UPI000D0B903E|nr:type IV pilus modification protein PilV [Phytohalomonas tamaricis]